MADKVVSGYAYKGYSPSVSEKDVIEVMQSSICKADNLYLNLVDGLWYYCLKDVGGNTAEPTPEFFDMNPVSLKDYAKNRKVANIEELKKRRGLKVGDVVEVLGYYNAGDGSGHPRKISDKDDGSGVLLDNGLYANIVHSGEVNVSWFGAKGDGVTDDTLAIQSAIDFLKEVKLEDKKYLVTNLILRDDTQITGAGKYKTSLITGTNIDLFTIKRRNVIQDFEIVITNRDYTSNIFYILSTNTRLENTDYREIKIRRLHIKSTSQPVGQGSLLCNVFKIVAVNNEGVYKVDISEVNATQVGRFVDMESNTGGWINSNKIRNCYSWSGYGLVKMRVNALSEIRDNQIDINYQNNINYPNTECYDIQTTAQIKDNKIKGYIWDLSHESAEGKGSNYGNCGMNFISNEVLTSKYFDGKYLLLGTLASIEGVSFVDFEISRYASTADNIKISIVNSIPDLRYYYTQQDLGLEFRYRKINNIIYLYMKSSVAWLDLSVSNSQCFTPAPYMSALTSVQNSTLIPMIIKKEPVFAVGGIISSKSLQTDLTNKVLSSSLNTIDDLIDNRNVRGVSFFVTTGAKIGLNTSLNYGCLFYDKGNITGLNNFGSNLIALSQNGDMHIRTYKDGWGAWETFQKTTTIQQLDTPYHASNMQKLGILDKYHNYLSELHEYEKSQNTQNVPDGVMNLSINQPPVIPTEVEEYAKEYNLI